MSILFTTVPSKRLAQSITASSTSFQLSDILGWNGSALTASDFGTVLYAIFRDVNSTVMEVMEIDATTIASSSITINKRGLNFTGDLTTELTARKLTWVRGTTIVELGSPSPQLFQWLRAYIDGIAIAGSPDASTTAKGLVEEATQAEVDAGTAAGATSARLFINPSTHRGRNYNDYAADAGSTDAYAITITPAITAYAAGQVFVFKANTANTGACTLNVSGLGAKDIKKAVSTDLATGDIAVNQICTVIYDGTNMQLQSTIPTVNPVTNVYTASATWTKPASGLKYVTVEVLGPGGTGGTGQNNADSIGSSGGGAGGYSRKTIAAASLASSETVTVGTGANSATSSFGTHVTATAGGSAGSNTYEPGIGGVGASGDLNLTGGAGGVSAPSGRGGTGGASFFGGGGRGALSNSGGGTSGSKGSGGGGGGGRNGSGATNGGTGEDGLVIVTEYY